MKTFNRTKRSALAILMGLVMMMGCSATQKSAATQAATSLWKCGSPDLVMTIMDIIGSGGDKAAIIASLDSLKGKAEAGALDCAVQAYEAYEKRLAMGAVGVSSTQISSVGEKISVCSTYLAHDGISQ